MKVDPNVWIQAMVCNNSFKCHEMVFVCVNDSLLVSHQPRQVLNLIAELHTTKPGSDKAPEIHLGANIEKAQTPDRQEIWSQLPRTCVKNAVCAVEDLLKENGKGCTLKSNVKNPLPANDQSWTSQKSWDWS
jgi:hypothetical protein